MGASISLGTSYAYKNPNTILYFIAFALLNYFFAEADRNSVAANAFLYFTSFALTYAVAFISYRFFELPFLKLKRKFEV